MKKFLFTILALVGLVVAFSGCSKDDSSAIAETINVSVSYTPTELFNGTEATFGATVNNEIKEATFYLDGKSIGSVISEPYCIKYKLKDIEPGNHKVSCSVKSTKGNEFIGETSFLLKLRLGDEYQGGRIFKLNKDGKSGLIGSTEDLAYNGEQGTEVRFYWGIDGIIGTTHNDGKTNTALMAEKATSPSFAAYHFKNGYSHNGFTDWYIPSIDELEILKDNKSYVGNFSNETNWNAMYWSSSEQSESMAFILNFNALMGNTNKKGRVFKIRPIRQF